MKTNTPSLWQNILPLKTGKHHKYHYGHALIYGAPQLTGASSLAAGACARIGAGLTTLIAPTQTDTLYRTILPPHIMVRSANDIKRDDSRITARLYGPGGITEQPDFTIENSAVILDADALKTLPARLATNYALTPHQGEFDRAFPTLKGTREQRTQAAADKMQCIIVLKGETTLIAAPNQDIIQNTHATPWLATAGSGDVLAGIITGLAAQNMPLREACAAAVWIHGQCAHNFGNHLVASDLITEIPRTMKQFL